MPVGMQAPFSLRGPALRGAGPALAVSPQSRVRGSPPRAVHNAARRYSSTLRVSCLHVVTQRGLCLMRVSQRMAKVWKTQ